MVISSINFLIIFFIFLDLKLQISQFYKNGHTAFAFKVFMGIFLVKMKRLPMKCHKGYIKINGKKYSFLWNYSRTQIQLSFIQSRPKVQRLTIQVYIIYKIMK